MAFGMSGVSTGVSQQAVQQGQQATDEQIGVMKAMTKQAAEAAQAGIEQQFEIAGIQNAKTNAEMVGKFIKGMSSASKELAG